MVSTPFRKTNPNWSKFHCCCLEIHVLISYFVNNYIEFWFGGDQNRPRDEQKIDNVKIVPSKMKSCNNYRLKLKKGARIKTIVLFKIELLKS